jgi:hypothetical protein
MKTLKGLLLGAALALTTGITGAHAFPSECTDILGRKADAESARWHANLKLKDLPNHLSKSSPEYITEYVSIVGDIIDWTTWADQYMQQAYKAGCYTEDERPVVAKWIKGDQEIIENMKAIRNVAKAMQDPAKTTKPLKLIPDASHASGQPSCDPWIKKIAIADVVVGEQSRSLQALLNSIPDLYTAAPDLKRGVLAVMQQHYSAALRDVEAIDALLVSGCDKQEAEKWEQMDQQGARDLALEYQMISALSTQLKHYAATKPSIFDPPTARTPSLTADQKAAGCSIADGHVSCASPGTGMCWKLGHDPNLGQPAEGIDAGANPGMCSAGEKAYE